LDIPYTIFVLSFIASNTSRYDDTNPEAEKKEYIDHIEEIVQWMGWKPFKVCFSAPFLLFQSSFLDV
jgi:glutamyl/glutaminyl-tRNA synthetase